MFCEVCSGVAERCEALVDALGVGVVAPDGADEDDSLGSSWNMTCFFVGRSVGSMGSLTAVSTSVSSCEAASTARCAEGGDCKSSRLSSTSMSSSAARVRDEEGLSGGSCDGTSSLTVGVGMYSSSAPSGRSPSSASA